MSAETHHRAADTAGSPKAAQGNTKNTVPPRYSTAAAKVKNRRVRYSHSMRLRFLIALLSVAALVLFVQQQNQPLSVIPLPQTLQQLTDVHPIATELLETLEREVTAPLPLRSSSEQPAGRLTTSGILAETNRQRTDTGAPSLKPNAALDRAAARKLDDMFAAQYFSHVSPSGTGPADVVENAGYAFLRVGENLALGNFASNAELVEAWMNSEGHRANILDKNFTELGVAAREGTFEGKRTWLAVQTFALPASACPVPSRQLRAEFEQKKTALDELAARLGTLKQEYESLAAAGEEKIEEGNRAIERGNEVAQETQDNDQAQPYWDRGKQLQDEGQALIEQAREKQVAYNETVDKFNAERAAIESLVSRLNRQIAGYNACLKRWQ